MRLVSAAAVVLAPFLQAGKVKAQTSHTWDFEDETMQGFELESGDCGQQPVAYAFNGRSWTPPGEGNTHYVNTYYYNGQETDIPVCAYADKTNIFQIGTGTTITWYEGSQHHKVCVKRLSDDAELACHSGSHLEFSLVQRSITASQLSAYVGQHAYMWFADETADGWGHIQLDDMVVSGASSIGASEPTATPTAAPTPVPWDIITGSTEVNFGLNSTNQLVFNYQIGKARDYKAFLYAGGCKASGNNRDITGIDFTMTNTTVHEMGTHGMDNLTLSYSFDTANITSSNMWVVAEDNTTKVELCQVLQLTTQGPDGIELVITEDMRNITIDFDLDINFEIEGGVDLAGATIKAEQQNTSLSNFITAFKCSGEFGSLEDTTALAPNTELHVCIKSLSDEVIINKIVSMQIDGKNPANEDSSLAVITNDAATLPAFTTLSFATPKPNEVIVTTRVPINMFDFEAVDANIAVSGALTVALDDGTRRRLTISKTYRALQDAGNEAAFELNIGLQPNSDAGLAPEDGGAIMMNSAKGAASKGFVVLGMTILASAYALW